MKRRIPDHMKRRIPAPWEPSPELLRAEARRAEATAKIYRLIIAAPDLLAALKWLVEQTTNGIGDETVAAVGAARAAIAKAEGTS